MESSPLLQTTLRSVIESILNEALALDAATFEQLAALEGRVIKVLLVPIGNPVFVHLGKTISLRTELIGKEDALIKGSPPAILSFFLKGNSQATTLEGDTALLDQLAQLGQNLEIDWEAKLSEHLGQSTAHLVSRPIQNIRNWLKYTQNQFFLDADEYLHYEVSALPSKNEQAELQKHIEFLSEKVPFLEERIQKLEQSFRANKNKENQ